MKITVNVDCTPQEARAFFGLPDMTPVNDTIIKAMVKRTQENIDTLSDPKLFWEKMMSASGQGMDAFNAMMSMMTKQQGGTKK